MNEYHVVFRCDITTNNQPQLSYASGREDQMTGPGLAPIITTRVYPSLVKDNDSRVTLEEVRYQQAFGDRREQLPFSPIINSKDVSDDVQLIISGKHIVQDNQLLPAYRFVERFQDVRHIFKTPLVDIQPIQRFGTTIKDLWFGEYVLYSEINNRRAALAGPIDVPLMAVNPGLSIAVPIAWSELRRALSSYPNYYREVNRAPESVGEWREHPEKADIIEIFFKRNVYSFSSIGLKVKDETNKDAIIVGHVSGGFSGRVGTSVEAVAENMIGHGYCSDAMIMDEGFDVFQLINSESENGGYQFTNEEILRAAAALTADLIRRSKTQNDVRNSNKVGNLNDNILDELDQCLKNSPDQDEDLRRANILFPVKPLRTQIRSILIFAKKIPCKVDRTIKTNFGDYITAEGDLKFHTCFQPQGIFGQYVDATRILGYYNPNDGKVYINDTLDKSVKGETCIHEGLHFYSVHNGEQLQRRFNEGVTEYFTKKKSASVGLESSDIAYRKEWEIVSQIANKFGEEALKKAYFQGEANALKTVIDEQLGQGTFDEISQCLENGNYYKAKKILKQGI